MATNYNKLEEDVGMPTDILSALSGLCSQNLTDSDQSDQPLTCLGRERNFLVNMSGRSMSQQLLREGLLHPSVAALKLAAQKKKKEARKFQRRADRRERSSRFVKTTFEEPSAYFMDLKWKQRQASSEASDFPDYSHPNFHANLFTDLQRKGIPQEFTDALKNVQDTLPHAGLASARQIISISVWIWQLRRSKNKTDSLLCTYQFMNGLYDGALRNVSHMKWAELVDYFYQDTGIAEFKEEEEFLAIDSVYTEAASVTDLFDYVLSSDFVSALRDIILSLVSLKLFKKDFAKNIVSFLGRPKKMSVLEILAHLIDGIMCLYRFSSGLMEGKTFMECWNSEDMFDSFVAEAEKLFTYTNRLSIGLPRPYTMDHKVYYQRLRELASMYEDCKGDLNLWDPRCDRINAIVLRLYEELSRMAVMLASMDRVTPFALALVGDPGIGKSMILPLIYNILANVKGYEYRSDMVYTRVKTSSYWEGYQPLSQYIIHYSEVGNAKGSMVVKTGDEILSEIQSLIDSTPFCVDMAFEDKGKVYASPDMVVIDTNNPTLHADKLMYSKSAIMRRFVFVRMVVREEFRKEGSTAICPTKSAEAGGSIYDRYIFNVYEHLPVGNDTRVNELLVTHDVQELLAFLEERLRAHIKVSEFRLFNQMNTLKDSNRQFFEHAIQASQNDFELENEEKVEIDIPIIPMETKEELDYRYEEITVNSDGSCVYERRSSILPEIPHDFFEDVDVETPPVREELLELGEYDARDEKEAADFMLDDEAERFAQKAAMAAYQSNTESSDLGRFSMLFMFIILTYIQNFFRFAKLNCIALRDLCGGGFLLFVHFCVVNFKSSDYVVFSLLRFLIAFGISVLVYVSPYLTFVFCLTCVLFIDFVYVFDSFVNRSSDFLRERGEKLIYNSVQRFGYLYFANKYNKYVDKRWKRYGSILLATMGVSVLSYAFYKWWFNSVVESESTEFVHVSKHNDFINELETEMVCDRSRVRVANKGHASWTVVDHTQVVPALHNGPVRQLHDVVARNIRLVCVNTEMGRSPTHILGIMQTFALINKHAFNGCSKGVVEIYLNGEISGIPISVVVNLDNCCEIGDDLLVFNCRNKINFRDISKHFIQGGYVERTEGMFDGVAVNPMMIHNLVVKHDKTGNSFTMDNAYTYKRAFREPLCGIPVIGRIGKSGVAIIGIHCAGVPQGKKNDDTRYAQPILGDDVLSAVSYVEKKMPYSSAYSESSFDIITLLPSVKSSFVYEDLALLRYRGRIEGPVMMNNSSSLTLTKMAKYLPVLFQEHFEFERDEIFVRPPMRPFTHKGEYRSMYNIGLVKMNKDPPCLDFGILEIVIERYTKRILDGLASKGITSISPLQLGSAINGENYDAFLRSINTSTSAGYGFDGGKAAYLPKVDGDRREPSDYLKGKILQAFTRYESKECVGFIYKAQLKDEPRAYEKARLGKTRIFYMSSVDNLVVSRMLLAPLYTLMVEFSEIFGTAVGINMHTEADYLYNRLLSFSTNLMEGDYSGFDLSNPVEISSAACQVIINVLRALGYTERAIVMLRGILSDVLFPYINMLGDLFVKSGMQPSGKYGTAEDNSMRGIIMLMYAWYSHDNLEGMDFFEHVLPVTYGDDMVAAVSDEAAPHFNNLVYQEDCLELYGMRFTSATKSDDLEIFIAPENMSFLRRKFIYLERTGCVVAQLDRNSLYKALQWYIPSKIDSEEEQMISTVRSVLWEAFFWLDNDQFNAFRKHMTMILCTEFEREDYDFPTYQFIEDRLYATNLDTTSISSGETLKVPVVHFAEQESCLAPFHKIVPVSKYRESYDSQPSEVDVDSRDAYQWHAENKEENNDLQGLEILQYVTDIDLMIQRVVDIKLEDAGFDVELLRSDPDWSDPLKRSKVRYQSQLEDLKSTVVALKRIKKRRRVFSYTESGDLSVGQIDEVKIDEQGNVLMVQGDVPVTVSDDVNYELNNGQLQHLSLEEFFARPVEIANFDMSLGASVSNVYPVWDLYTIEPSVRAKLRNYAYLRADLVVKVSVSGSPFHYGRLLISYQPYPERNETLINYSTAPAGYRPLLLNYLTQSNGCVVMDIKANEPIELKCPFISTKPQHRLYNSSTTVISSVTSFEDLEEAGSVFVYTLNDVNAVNASASPVSVQIYAWLENVQLGCITATQVAVTTESGDDERKTGPIEKFASNAAKVSDALTKVPFLHPFAKASSIVFHGIRGVSSIFGWSKPVMDEEISYVKTRPFSNGAVCIGQDTCKRVVYDPHQEITVDPSVVGIDIDDMIIRNIAERETYLTTFTWSPESPKMSNPMFVCRVQPQLDTIFEGTTRDFYQPTALSYSATPFAYWRGKIKYRFDIVTSQYHRGKLAFYYEPNVGQEAIIDADIDLNKQYIRIIDIQETQSVEFCVDWASGRGWNKCIPSASSILNYGTHFSATEDSFEFINGYIGVTVFTDIQSPDDSSVEINVFVSGEDMHYNQMISANMPASRVFTESGDLADVPVSCLDLNPTGASDDWVSDYHFGEQPVSFRSLMKRYQYSQDEVISAGLASDITLRASMLIYPPILPAYGASTASARKNLYSYLRYAYLGMRGSMKKRLHVAGNYSFSSNLTNTGITIGDLGSSTASSMVWATDPVFASSKGTVSFVPSLNGGLEFELPFYTSNFFVFSFADDLVGTNNTNDMSSSWSRTYQADIECDDPTSGAPHLVESQAIGEDFSFMRFTGAPLFSSIPIV